jgi:hypothetical protein
MVNALNFFCNICQKIEEQVITSVYIPHLAGEEANT